MGLSKRGLKSYLMEVLLPQSENCRLQITLSYQDKFHKLRFALQREKTEIFQPILIHTVKDTVKDMGPASGDQDILSFGRLKPKKPSYLPDKNEILKNIRGEKYMWVK